MATAITAAGESLIAQLQAAGKPLVIDQFIFANVAGQNPSDPIAPGADVPAEDIVFVFDIPDEYRAFVNPNQVVYSALLGSDVGDFTFNWQGLYCSAHSVLVAVSTFPAVEKHKTDTTSGQSGNNITRNFMIEFIGAKEATGITVEASTWQLDFSVRLAGIDERERLSNRDLYGRASFLADGWALVNDGGDYKFSPGTGYVEGIRLALAEALLLPAPALPCSVWLDVALEPSGSDVGAVVAPITAGPDDKLTDYTTAAPFHTRHYLERVATIDAAGDIVDKRSKSLPLANMAINGKNATLIDGAFDFNSKISALYAITQGAPATGTWLNAPPCRTADERLYGGFFDVSVYFQPGGVLHRVVQRYTVYQSGPYQGVEYTRTWHVDSNVWSDWQHNGWKPNCTRALTYAVPTEAAKLTMPVTGDVIVELRVNYQTAQTAQAIVQQGTSAQVVMASLTWDGASNTVRSTTSFLAPKGAQVWIVGYAASFKIVPRAGE